MLSPASTSPDRTIAANLTQVAPSGNQAPDLIDSSQSGNDNQLEVKQTETISNVASDANLLYSTQIGNDNELTVTQTGLNYAEGYQSGNSNQAWITQDNTSAGSTTATRNIAGIYPRSAATTSLRLRESGGGNQSYIYQPSSSNTASVTANRQQQCWGTNLRPGGSDNASITQTGNNNYAAWSQFDFKSDPFDRSKW